MTEKVELVKEADRIATALEKQGHSLSDEARALADDLEKYLIHGI